MTDLPSTPDLVLETLGPEQVWTVYPLISAADPSITLVGWLRYARQAAGRGHARRGVLVARRPALRHPSGAVCYRSERHVRHGVLLTAEHYVALDIVQPEAVLAALVAGLDRVAETLGCAAIRSVVHGAGAALADKLREAGHQVEAVTYTRLLPGAPRS